jgi:hypothetical protein
VFASLLMSALPAAAQVVQEFARGLLSPIKLLAIPGGGLLVAEAGIGPNTGRVSLLDRDGRRFTVIEGLPSGRHLLEGDFGGPSGLLLTSRRLYIVIGGGDTVIPGAVPGSEILNPSPSSPLFSSVLLLEFPDGNLPFDMTLPSGPTHARIAAGEGIYLRSASGQNVRVSRLADIPNSIPEPLPAEPRHVRISNTFGIVGNDSLVSVVDASRNVIWNIPIVSGTSPTIVASFPSVPNTNPALGPPVVDAVPASIREAGGDFVVSFLTGFPFGAGAASIWRVNRTTGAVARIAGGLQTAVDVLPINADATLSYVIEYSTNFLAGAPGRLLQVDATRGTTLVLATGLLRPTNMAKDLRSGDLYVTEYGGGRVVRVLVP